MPAQYPQRFLVVVTMLAGSSDATTAALAVDYESPSQFRREYRRLFGLPPFQDIKALRKIAGAVEFANS